MATLTIADLDNGKRDLETVDAIANSPADFTTTRFGDSVLTLAGALRRLGYQAPVPYASGLTVASGLFTVSKDGVVYAPDPALVPFTTGAWNASQWLVVQADPNLRADLAAPGGSSLVGFGNRTAQDKLRESRNILDFGGSPDGTTDNAAAVLAMHAAGLPLVFPFVAGSANSYRITGAMDFYSVQNAIFDVADGASLGLDTIASLHWTNKFVRATRIKGVQFSDETIMPGGYGAYVTEKPMWLGAADIDASQAELMQFNRPEMTYAHVSLSADTWAPSSPSSPSPYVATTITPPSIDVIDAVMTRIRAGSEVSAVFSNIANVQMGIIVRHSAGYVAIVADNLDFSKPTVLSKLIGSPLSYYDFDYPGRAVNAAYSGKNAVWSIRRTGRDTFTVLINGQAILRNYKCEGDIAFAGFCVRAIAASPSAVLNNFVLQKYKKRTGGGAIRVGCFGDSITSDIFVGSWPRWVSKFIDGASGTRCINLKNYAISGATSAQMYTVVANATDLDTLDYALVLVGVNDEQGAVASDVYYNNLSGIVSVLQAAKVRVIIGIPSMFYSKALAQDGHGQDTTNYASGAMIRGVAKRVASGAGCKLVDVLGDMGTIQPQFLNPARTDDPFGPYVGDPAVADNIHPTGYGHMLIARAFAESVIGDIHTTGTEEVSTPETAFLWYGSAGWASNASAVPSWSRTASGVVTLTGLIDKGSVTADGTVIATLPLALCPVLTQRVVAFNGSPTPHMLQIDPTGELRVYNFPASGASYCGLDGVTYQA